MLTQPFGNPMKHVTRSKTWNRSVGPSTRGSVGKGQERPGLEGWMEEAVGVVGPEIAMTASHEEAWMRIYLDPGTLGFLAKPRPFVEDPYPRQPNSPARVGILRILGENPKRA